MSLLNSFLSLASVQMNHYWFISRGRNRYLTKDGKLCPTVWIPLGNRRTTGSS